MPDALTPDEARQFKALAAIMIPASAEYSVPGADDPAIFADILKSVGRDLADVRSALAHLASLAGGDFAALPDARRAEVAMRLKAEGGASLFALNRLVLLCYYRDDRVMLSLGQEPRPPFPKGHLVEQGDWSLLEPVKRRPPFWRRPR